jgi:hypothetical protein
MNRVKTVEGTQMKLEISLCLPNDLTMDEVDFFCYFYIHPNKRKKFEKAEMNRMDSNNYAVILDTKGMGDGEVKYQASVTLPDGRTEIIKGSTTQKISYGLQ